MKLVDHLDDKSKEQLKKIRKRKNKKKRGPYEGLTSDDYKELMGMNRTTYERKNGAIRRK